MRLVIQAELAATSTHPTGLAAGRVEVRRVALRLDLWREFSC